MSVSVEEDEQNILQNFSLPFKQQIHNIALDSTGSFVALGGKTALHVLNLGQRLSSEQPNYNLLSVTQPEKWDSVVIEWNGHQQRKDWIASSSNQKTLIWQVTNDQLSLQGTLQSHTRAVADISWSVFDANILATCSADTYINLWDVRDPQRANKMKSFCGWTAGATQVKWNRKNSMTLASSHNGEVRIWDIRKVSSPTTFITAHMAKIYGIDWSYSSENDLLTCSEDKQIKLWNTTTPRVCKGTIQAGYPLMKAKFTPFGCGLITMAQRGDYALKLWNLNDLTTSVHQFIGHNDIATSFDWRSVKVNEKVHYQLVSWSKDQTLRFWPLSQDIQDLVQKKTTQKDPEEAMVNVLDSSMESPFEVKDLAQELSILRKRKLPNIEFDQISLVDRFVVVSITGKQSLKIRISFPQLYPNGAVPSIQLIPTGKTVISTHTQVKLVEAFNTTAISHVEQNKPCLFACLTQLGNLLKDTFDDEPQSELNVSTILKMPANMESDMTIPAPRTSSGIFGFSDTLVTFNSFSYRSRTIANYKDFKDFRTGKVPQEQLSISSYFYLNPKNGLSRSTDMLEGPMRAKARDTRLKFYNLSNLTFLNYNLCSDFCVLGPILEVCAHNIEIAKREGRKDLIQLWSLLQIVLHPTVFDLNNQLLTEVWSNHPLGKPMLKKLISHYQKLKDLPTLAVIACLLMNPDSPEGPASPSVVNSAAPFLSLTSLHKLTSKSQLKGMISQSPPPSPPKVKFQGNLFDEEASMSMRGHVRAFAEVLWRWGLFEKRCEILKFLLPAEQISQNIWTVECKKCKRTLKSTNYCSYCRDYGFTCAICHLPIRGHSTFCFKCHHGGHTACLQAWFVEEKLCSSGCGCSCLDYSAFFE